MQEQLLCVTAAVVAGSTRYTAQCKPARTRQRWALAHILQPPDSQTQISAQHPTCTIPDCNSFATDRLNPTHTATTTASNSCSCHRPTPRRTHCTRNCNSSCHRPIPPHTPHSRPQPVQDQKERSRFHQTPARTHTDAAHAAATVAVCCCCCSCSSASTLTATHLASTSAALPDRCASCAIATPSLGSAATLEAARA